MTFLNGRNSDISIWWTQAVLGLTASDLSARAVPIDFTYTGSLVDFTVRTTGPYQILAYGRARRKRRP